MKMMRRVDHPLRGAYAVAIAILLGCTTNDTEKDKAVPGTPNRAVPAVAPGTAPSEFLFQAYVESCKYPERFDQWVTRNRSRFDDIARNHVELVKARLWREAREDIELCNQHADPLWVQQCLSERPAANIWFWLASVETAFSGTRWAETFMGQVLVFGKEQAEIMMPGSWESIFELALQQVEGSIRHYLGA